MEKFGFSGLWKHVRSSVLAALVLVADPLIAYFNGVQLPAWAHAVVGLAAAVLAFYKGQPKAPELKPVP